jgi:hypothetical protein
MRVQFGHWPLGRLPARPDLRWLPAGYPAKAQGGAMLFGHLSTMNPGKQLWMLSGASLISSFDIIPETGSNAYVFPTSWRPAGYSGDCLHSGPLSVPGGTRTLLSRARAGDRAQVPACRSLFALRDCRGRLWPTPKGARLFAVLFPLIWDFTLHPAAVLPARPRHCHSLLRLVPSSSDRNPAGARCAVRLAARAIQKISAYAFASPRGGSRDKT